MVRVPVGQTVDGKHQLLAARRFQVPGDLLDRLPFDEMLPPNPADRLHNQHPPTTRSHPRAGSLLNAQWRGSILGSDADLMVSGIGKADDAGLQEIDLAPAVHLALDELELGDLSLGLTVRPG